MLTVIATFIPSFHIYLHLGLNTLGVFVKVRPYVICLIVYFDEVHYFLTFRQHMVDEEYSCVFHDSNH